MTNARVLLLPQLSPKPQHTSRFARPAPVSLTGSTLITLCQVPREQTWGPTEEPCPVSCFPHDAGAPRGGMGLIERARTHFWVLCLLVHWNPSFDWHLTFAANWGSSALAER